MLCWNIGKESHTPVPNGGQSSEELRVFITQHLSDFAGALEPLCGPGCGSLAAQPYHDMKWPLALLSDRSRGKFVLLYQPNEFREILAGGELVAAYGVAHELGHYVDIAVAGSELNDPWRSELGADSFAGCAFATLGLPFKLVSATVLAAAAAEDSIDSQLDLVCGSDSEHPAIRWEMAAFTTGAQLCHSSVAPLDRLEAEVDDLTRDTKRAAEKARAWFPPKADPCRSRRLESSLRATRTER